MKAILIDDEVPALEELEFILKEENVDVLGTYTDATKGLGAIKKQQPDVVFLDISMPEEDGFSVANKIKGLKCVPAIVFATAYDDHAIKAFEIDATDYILKPFDESRIRRTLARLETKDKTSTKSTKTEITSKKCTKLPVWKGDRIHLICCEQILFCTSVKGQTHIITGEAEYSVGETLSHLEAQLGEGFFRCHRSYLVNIEKVGEIIPWFNNTYAIKVDGHQEEVPVSRRHVKEFKRLFGLTV